MALWPYEGSWRLSPVGYVALVVTPKKLAQPGEVICGLLQSNFCLDWWTMKATWWFWYVCSLSLKDRKNFRRCSMEWEARCYGSWMKSVPLMNSLCLSLLGEQLRVFRGEDGPHEVRAGSNIGILIPPRGTRARIFRPQSATVPKLRSALTKNSFLLLLCLFYFFLTHFLLFFFLPNKSVV